MTDRSRTSQATTFPDTSECISLPASAAGITPSILPDGVDLFGQAPAPASPSVPPSTNRVRRIDWANRKSQREFYLHADLFIMAYGPRPPPVRMITGPYELDILIPERSRLDLDNHVKALIDYLVESEFTPGDAKKYLRGYSIHWAPIEHCRVTIRGLP